MLGGITADHFNVDVSGVRLSRDLLPLASCEFNRITRVGNNVQSEPKIVRSNAVRESISFPLYPEIAQIAQSLFDRIYPQVNSFQFCSQALGKRRFSGPRKPGEDE
jgi:hypothetical protein